jgi:cellulose synthase/poly-beta-1,6-N-acetylglucosamine synthase-like glycosyltransferase
MDPSPGGALRGALSREADRQPSVSIIIPVKNEQEMIDSCLKSLLNLDYQEYEIILVDNGSTDGTLEIAEKTALSDARVRILSSGGYTGAARNVGILAAKGDIMAFIDGDCIAPSDWLKQLVNSLSEEPITTAGVGGPNIPMDKIEGLWTVTINSMLQTFLGSAGSIQVRLTKKDYVRSLSSANSAFRAETVRKVGGFDPRLFLCEDSDFSARLLKSGFRLRFARKALVYHARDYHRLSNFGRQMFRYGQGRGDAILIKPKTNLSFTALGLLSFLVLEIALFLDTFLGNGIAKLFFALLTSTYLALIVGTSLVLGRGANRKSLATFVAFLALHGSYTSGLVAGLFSRAAKTIRRGRSK